MAVMHLYDANGNLLWLTETTHFDFAHYASVAKVVCAEEGDGLLVFDPRKNQVWIINADGSDGEFCGNGLQATAFHAGQKVLDLTMGSRQIAATVEGVQVQVLLEPSAALPQSVEWQGVTAYTVKMPNPHCVFIAPPEAWGLAAEGRRCCEEKNTNVEWVRDDGDVFVVNVYERGAGITAACGSGALAVFEVLRYLGRVSEETVIKMPGGILTVRAIGSKLSLQGQVRLLKSRVL